MLHRKQMAQKYHRVKQNNMCLIVYLLAATIKQENIFGNQCNFI